VVKETTAYWVEHLESVGVPCGPIYTIDQMFADPQVQHLGMSMAIEHSQPGATRLVASPLNFEGTRKTIRTPTEIAGTHTEEVLRSLGYESDQIEQMRGSGAI
jgi:crotonobetainyl-CoA:carnitine CoA-transferase CaiB-like acyl-CoA transferase